MDHQYQHGFYQTGYTQPPRSNRGIIALLLIIIVILGTTTAVLGLLNIHLFHMLSTQSDATSVQFMPQADEVQKASNNWNCLGFSVTALSDFDREFYQYPQGVYITDVDPDSRAAKHGILAGDILISIQDIPTTDAEALDNFLNTCAQEQALNLVIFRDGQQHSIKLGG